MDKYFLICAAVIAIAGAFSDVRSTRIPNWMTYGGLVGALFTRSLVMGWPGLKSGAAGMLTAGGIFFVLFLVGGMGGGDVKLMASVAAWAGAGQVQGILLMAAIAGGFLAVAHMIVRGRVKQTLSNTIELMEYHRALALPPPGSERSTRCFVAGSVRFAIGSAFWFVPVTFLVGVTLRIYDAQSSHS